MRILVFTNKKGGVGKTTSALCTAACLSMMGKKVLGIDMDSQGNFTQASGGEADVQGTFDFLKGAPLEDVLQQGERYAFLGADRRLSRASSEFDGIGREHLLAHALREVTGYDYCVIDTPPSMEVLTLNALTAADDVVVCCQSDGFSVSGLADMKRNIDGVREWYNPRLRVAGILMTRYNPRTTLTRQLTEVFREAAQAMDTQVFQSCIRENTALREAQILKQDIYTYQPESHGAEDYAAFVCEYLKGAE